MVVRTINNTFPDFAGNMTLNFAGTLYDKDGLVNKPIKMWIGSTTTVADGLWSIDYSSANFEQVKYVDITLEATTNTAADKPLGAHLINKTNKVCNGKAYKVSSAGLLAAMQQIPAEVGTIVNVMVIGT